MAITCSSGNSNTNKTTCGSGGTSPKTPTTCGSGGTSPSTPATCGNGGTKPSTPTTCGGGNTSTPTSCGSGSTTTTCTICGTKKCNQPAICEPPPIAYYIVTFNPSGGSVSPTTRTVQYDKAVGSLPTPTKSGHSFIGWFTASGVQVTANTIINSNVTFFAEWEILVEKVNIVMIGGVQ